MSEQKVHPLQGEIQAINGLREEIDDEYRGKPRAPQLTVTGPALDVYFPHNQQHSVIVVNGDDVHVYSGPRSPVQRRYLLSEPTCIERLLGHIDWLRRQPA
jgi:hypothetical protein